MKIDCSKCEQEFECEEWIDGRCPHCKAPYGWEEFVIHDEDGFESDWYPCIHFY